MRLARESEAWFQGRVSKAERAERAIAAWTKNGRCEYQINSLYMFCNNISVFICVSQMCVCVCVHKCVIVCVCVQKCVRERVRERVRAQMHKAKGKLGGALDQPPIYLMALSVRRSEWILKRYSATHNKKGKKCFSTTSTKYRNVTVATA